MKASADFNRQHWGQFRYMNEMANQNFRMEDADHMERDFRFHRFDFVRNAMMAQVQSIRNWHKGN